MKKNLFSFILLLIVATSVGCLIENYVNQNKPNRLSFPDANYWRIAWLDNQLVAFVDSLGPEPLQFAKQGETDLSSILLSDDPRCVHSTHYSVQGVYLSDQIQILKFCITEPISITYFLAYNINTKRLSETAGPLNRGSIVAYWNPEGTYGLVHFVDGFSKETLYSIWEGGLGPLDVTINDEGKIWNLGDFYPDFPDIESTTGNAGRADWSPDGNFIAFFASPDSVGKSGLDRMYARYKLYIMDSDKQSPFPVLDDIYLPYIIKWSPDSRYIAFLGTHGSSSGQKGIWVYSLEQKSLHIIDSGDFKDVLWDLDNNHLIAIRCNQANECSEILEYDLTEVLDQ